MAYTFDGIWVYTAIKALLLGAYYLQVGIVSIKRPRTMYYVENINSITAR